MRILIVEDDLELADPLADLVTALGHDAEIVLTAEDAYGRLGAQRYDLVILDVMLPRLNGVELASMMCRRWPEARVVMVTALSPPPPLEGLRNVLRVLPKPFELDEFVAALDEVGAPPPPGLHWTG